MEAEASSQIRAGWDRTKPGEETEPWPKPRGEYERWGDVVRRLLHLTDGESCVLEVPAGEERRRYQSNLRSILSTGKACKLIEWQVREEGPRHICVKRVGIYPDVFTIRDDESVQAEIASRRDPPPQPSMAAELSSEVERFAAAAVGVPLRSTVPLSESLRLRGRLLMNCRTRGYRWSITTNGDGLIVVKVGVKEAGRRVDLSSGKVEEVLTVVEMPLPAVSAEPETDFLRALVQHQQQVVAHCARLLDVDAAELAAFIEGQHHTQEHGLERSVA